MDVSRPLLIRVEGPADDSMIRLINETAFSGAEEADLVEALRRENLVLLSLVAEIDGTLAGHVLFSRMWLDTSAGPVPAVALAPMAVLPAYQRRGIGTALIRYGLDAVRAIGERIVVVVGHADYYPRFGFSSEQARRLESPFPAEAFMTLELEPGALDGIRGSVRYPAAFGL